ncbi:DUF2141 domain-containing protein [Flagellimonas sp.]|uniref:DUF2141 domain-containing protein n=1 Tax=Flagellimonas sp. TaxID=2058762 RepID=UPI003B522226
MKSAILSFGMILCMLSIGSAQSTATLKVQIQDIESDEGMLRVGLYDSAQNWLEKTFKSKSSTIVNGKCEVVFEDVPYGEYAISVYHDENNNGKMDKYLGFYPKENYACSNQAPAKYGPPEWKDAKFTISQKTNQQLIKL